ncbi:MAG: orotate phosphoribosyltransferase [Alphaproteobacteria bacterium]|nr:orotate phosphoribosyltransferase [Alphaproteobacteria bacterium]
MSIADRTAEILLTTKCIQFSPNNSFTLTSGRSSPVYVDCRRLIAFVEERRQIVQFWKETLLERLLGLPFDCIAGGETAGIPYGAFLAEALDKPMAYIRKSPKGFGCNASIEGNLKAGERVLLVEDLATDGRSKVRFINAIRTIGAKVAHCVVVFEYGIFADKTNVLAETGVTLHSLATWKDIMAYATNHASFSEDVLEEVQKYLDAPNEWHPSKRLKLKDFDQE